jgi:hypothetical protein
MSWGSAREQASEFWGTGVATWPSLRNRIGRSTQRSNNKQQIEVADTTIKQQSNKQ